MQIVVKNNDLMDFGEVPCGKVVRIDCENGESIYAIKTDTIFDGMGDACNCVDLKDGSWLCMDNNEEVTVLRNASLVIE